MVTSALASLPAKAAAQPSETCVAHLGHALGANHVCCVGEVGGDTTGEAAVDPSWVLK